MIPLPPGVADLNEEEEIEGIQDEPKEEGDNAADPESLKKKRKRALKRMSDREQFWHEVMATEIGRAVVWEWIKSAGTFTNPSGVTPAGFPDHGALMFRLGQKSVGDALYHMLAALDRIAVLQMHDEHDPDFQNIAKNKGYR